MPLPQRHFVILDLYRFVAASMVVAYHFHAQIEQPSPDWAGKNLDLFVDFFFVLSGFVIAHSYKDGVTTRPEVARFLRKRFARLYPLHLLTLGIMVLLAILVPHLDDKHFVFAALPYQLTMLQTFSSYPLSFNYPSWSISVEWVIYFAFPILMFLNRRWGALPLFGFIVAAIFARKFIDSELVEFTPLRAIPTFVAGLLIAVYGESANLKRGALLGAGIFLVATVLVLLHAHRYLIATMFALTIAATIADRNSQAIVSKYRIVRTLGDASYSIYLLHVPMLLIFFELIWHRALGLGPVPLFIGCIFWLALVTASILVFHFFERPAQEWINGPPRRILHAKTG